MSFLPEEDRAYLTSKGFKFEEREEGAKRAIILRGVALPDGRFDAEAADILILLPAGYPDVPPDMFYLIPWVKLVDGERYPKAATRPFSFGGESWQRWSRHNSEWRPGTDGIWTTIKRVQHALKVAA